MFFILGVYFESSYGEGFPARNCVIHPFGPKIFIPSAVISMKHSRIYFYLQLAELYSFSIGSKQPGSGTGTLHFGSFWQAL